MKISRRRKLKAEDEVRGGAKSKELDTRKRTNVKANAVAG